MVRSCGWSCNIPWSCSETPWRRSKVLNGGSTGYFKFTRVHVSFRSHCAWCAAHMSRRVSDVSLCSWKYGHLFVLLLLYIPMVLFFFARIAEQPRDRAWGTPPGLTHAAEGPSLGRAIGIPLSALWHCLAESADSCLVRRTDGDRVGGDSDELGSCTWTKDSEEFESRA